MKKIKKSAAWLLGSLALAAALPLSAVTSYAASFEGEVPGYGFLVTGDNVVGTEGFQNNIVYLTEEDFTLMKENRNPQDYGLGDSWVSDARYSSYDNHGQGNYHYTIADGIDLLSLIQSTAPVGADSCYVYSMDGYSTKLRLDDVKKPEIFCTGGYPGSLVCHTDDCIV